MKRMKRQKSPRTDGITGEMNQAEQTHSGRNTKKICKQAWKEERTPEE